ncbi:DEAD/DEAH box helicase [Sulfuricurvum sp.]|uniref:DEAD/DEAH box helicase n=1 Tax=Sulfuricurvum sp. TaxID=2025608 RepID=UPI002637611F|nr:DEAD/DEAH box helicase [Sulfuricurvum sp.]MDD4950712.1 DEAD/DEAH box helicase [Sulfuricurvum sp.]
MGKYLDAIALSDNLKKRIEETIISNIAIRDTTMLAELRAIIETKADGLISDILVEGAYSAKKHEDILRNIPFLSKKFIELLDMNKIFNPNYFPFKHQYETLKLVNDMEENNKPAIVVTAPTGSGKTESFLLPMLNDLVIKPRKADEKGVRAIILYPMNALVADQNKRLYSYLQGQSNIRMFFYNSETPEDKKYATEEFKDKCFVRTRKEARDNPPDIMITNYSMLEYILSRPNDYPLIGNALRTVIVDEAHLYTGTLAAEVSMLLKRVAAKAKVKTSSILHIATTATISEDKEEQWNFFSKFFNKENIQSIAGQKEFKEIATDIDVNGEVAQFHDISDLVKKSNFELYNEFQGYRVFPKILKILAEKYAITLNELLGIFANGMDEQTLLNIFTIGAKARQNDNEMPLLPHKMHLQVRSSQGFSVCSNPHCSDSKIEGIGKVHHGLFYNCTTCKSPTLNLVRCSECGEHFYCGSFNDKDTLFLERYPSRLSEKEGTLLLSKMESSEPVYIDVNGKKCSEYDFNNQFYRHSECPVCSNDEFYSLDVSDQFLIPLVAETMLVNMPEIDKEVNVFLPAKGRRLLAFSDSRSAAARLGPLLTSQHETQLFRRLIIDTVSQISMRSKDNGLRDFFEEEIRANEKKLSETDNPLVRIRIQEKIDEAKSELSKMYSGISIVSLVEALEKHPLLGEFFDRDRMKDQSPDEREQLAHNKNLDGIATSVYLKLAEALSVPNEKQTNLESIGLIGFEFQLDADDLKTYLDRYFLGYKFDYVAIMKSFIYLFRKLRSVTIESSDTTYKDYHSRLMGLGTYVTFNGKNKNLFNLKATSRNAVYKFTAQILSNLNIEDSEDNVYNFLEAVYNTFMSLAKRNDIKWVEWGKIQTEDDRIVEAFRLVFHQFTISQPENLHLNTINNTLWKETVDGLIPHQNSITELQAVTQDDLDKDPYFSRYRKLYRDESLELSMGLWAEEHSAQLSSQENRRLQDLFIQGKRNVLSATTTLEVGIDIGGLSGVLMANVPPNKANYIQRSGRAGRRTDGSSIILTYTKTRHFDQNVFRNFKFYLDKPHKKLTISLEKEKLAIRHLNSYMLSKFYENNVSADGLIFDSFKSMGYFVGVYELPKHTDNAYGRVELDVDENSICQQFLKFLSSYAVTLSDEEIFEDIFKYTNKKPEFKALIRNFYNAIDGISTDYLNNLKALYADWNFATSASHKNAIRYSIKQKHGESLIEVFSNAQVLPKYGFPIDVKTLQVINGKKLFELSRGSFLALSEYVPGSKILAGGMLVESKGISKHFTGTNLDEAFGEKGFIYTCSNGHFFTSPYTKVHECNMPGCTGIIRPSSHYLIPEYGYITAASDKLSYDAGNPEKVGKLEIHSAIHNREDSDVVFEYEDFSVVYKDKATIYGINKGDKGLGFAVCTKCGYTVSENDKAENGTYDKLPNGFKKHPPIYSESNSIKCLDTTPTVWRNHQLLAKMTTDAILIIPKRKIDGILLAQTLSNAFQLSGADELGIDEREISSLVLESDGYFNILLYDNQSGGVGYVYDLAKNRWESWMLKATERLFIDQKHDDECLHGCIKCIVTMNTNEPLPRKETLQYLENKDLVNNKTTAKKKSATIVKEELTKDDRLKRFKK